MEDSVKHNQETLRNIVGEKCHKNIGDFYKVTEIASTVIGIMSENWYKHVFLFRPNESKDKTVCADYDEYGVLIRIDIRYDLFTHCMSFFEEIMELRVEKHETHALVGFNNEDENMLSRLLVMNDKRFDAVTTEANKMLSERFKTASVSEEYVTALLGEIIQHSHLSMLKNSFGIGMHVWDDEKDLDMIKFEPSNPPFCSYVKVHPHRYDIVKFIVRHFLPFKVERDEPSYMYIIADKFVMHDYCLRSF